MFPHLIGSISSMIQGRAGRQGQALFHGSFRIPVLLFRPCHTRMGTARAQMAADGESEVPLQI